MVLTACARRIRLPAEPRPGALQTRIWPARWASRPKPLASPDTSGSAILGLEGLDYRLGGCCCPPAGEAIVGQRALATIGITILSPKMRQTSNTDPRGAPACRCTGKPTPNPQRAVTAVASCGIRSAATGSACSRTSLTRLSDSRINVSDARVRTT